MILIVLGLEALLYHSVFTTYLQIARQSSWGYKLLGVFVIASYSALVCIHPNCDTRMCTRKASSHTTCSMTNKSKQNIFLDGDVVCLTAFLRCSVSC